jgi:hypothetical protein
VDRLWEESAQTRALAAMADRDAAEVRTSLRGHTLWGSNTRIVVRSFACPA